jgi:hypothetical protein
MSTRRALAFALCAGVLAAGCAAGHGPAAAAPRPPAIPGLDTAGPDLSGVTIPTVIVPDVSGRVSRPIPRLTPGAIATTNTTVVCAGARNAVTQAIPQAEGAAVFEAYGLATKEQQKKFTLTYLVPLNLGGAATEANVWPSSLRGVGFFQEVQLNSVLRDLVCRRSLPLTEAQSLIRADWYAAWLEYVVSAGRG